MEEGLVNKGVRRIYGLIYRQWKYLLVHKATPFPLQSLQSGETTNKNCWNVFFHSSPAHWPAFSTLFLPPLKKKGQTFESIQSSACKTSHPTKGETHNKQPDPIGCTWEPGANKQVRNRIEVPNITVQLSSQWRGQQWNSEQWQLKHVYADNTKICVVAPLPVPTGNCNCPGWVQQIVKLCSLPILFFPFTFAGSHCKHQITFQQPKGTLRGIWVILWKTPCKKN